MKRVSFLLSGLVMMALVSCGGGSDDPADSIVDRAAPAEVAGQDIGGGEISGEGTFVDVKMEDQSGPEEATAEQTSELQAEDEFEVAGDPLDPGDLKKIAGKVVDGQGKPVADLFVQPCTYYGNGSEVCHKAISQADGSWSIKFDPAKKDVVAIHVRFVTDLYSASACYWKLEEAPFSENVVLFADPFVIIELDQELATIDFGIDKAVVLTMEGISLTVQPEEWFPGVFEPTVIRGLRFPLEQETPCFLGGKEPPDRLFVFSPDWLSFSTPGGVAAEFDNDMALAPGAQVDLYTLGGLDTRIIPTAGEIIHVHTGEWFGFGTGTVSEDGSVIRTDPGSGLPGLGWVGWRAP